MNDPVYGPAMRPKGRSGVVHVLGSGCHVDNLNVERLEGRRHLDLPCGITPGLARVPNGQDDLVGRRADTLLEIR